MTELIKQPQALPLMKRLDHKMVGHSLCTDLTSLFVVSRVQSIAAVNWRNFELDWTRYLAPRVCCSQGGWGGGGGGGFGWTLGCHKEGCRIGVVPEQAGSVAAIMQTVPATEKVRCQNVVLQTLLRSDGSAIQMYLFPAI